MKPTAKHNRRRNNQNRAASLFSKFMSCRALNSFGVLISLLCILALLTIAFVALPSAHASNPTSGTLTTSSTPITWQGTAVAGGATGDLGATGLFTSEDTCIEGISCDSFTLTVAGTPTDWANAKKLVHVHLGWTIPAQDFDLYIHKGDVNGPIVANSGHGVTDGVLGSEDADFDPSKPAIGTGTFVVHVVYWTATQAEQYTATASVEDAIVTPSPSPTPTPTPMDEPAGTPRFYNYLSPPGVGDSAGEPSIGVNWKTESVFNGIPNGGTVTYFGGFLSYMLRATFNDSFTPAKVAWEKAQLTLATAPRAYGDPILFTDSRNGRTFVSQELGKTPAGSTAEWTDDDGRSFLPSEGSGAPSGIDHQTIGAGPFHAPVPNGVNPLYPNGVWYCSQSIADAVCSISLDGGMTFGPAVPMYSLADCGGLHGHIKIGPDGTAYVPNRACHGDASSLVHAGGKPALLVSEDNGISWNIRTLDQATTKPDRDPSVGVASDGTVYFAYQAENGHSRVAVSHDKGLSWEKDTDIGAQLGIQNSLFHAAVAGDGDRAAVAFYGTTTGGTDYDQPTFEALWYLYIATTYDGGAHWWTQNVTPGDPIQRGGICQDGACRNLLDFFDATIDKEGRVLVGYDDGCVSHACITGKRSYGMPAENDFTAKAVIARQMGGKRMFAAYDPPAGPVPQPPAKPLPPPAPTSCDGLVAVDSIGDASNPFVSAAGSSDQIDMTKLSFALSEDKQSLITTITLKDFSTTPAPGTLGAYYRTVWTSATKRPDGSFDIKNYATEVATSLTGTTYRYGQYDTAENSFIGPVDATGSATTGPGGTLNVTVPLAALGNPKIPVTDPDALPAVIEPYAVIFVHEEAVYIVSPVDRVPDYGFAGANWAVCVPPPPPTIECLDDNDSRISYSDGWHLVNATNASGGHFRFHTGKSPDHSASLTFNVAAGKTGKLTYFYGTSTKGGTADVVLDGATRSVSYSGTSGGIKDPVLGSKIEFANLSAGTHTLVIRNMSDTVYVDGFCLESSTSSSRPATGPGATTSSNNNLSAGQQLLNNLPVATNATAVSLVAVSSNNLPIKVALISPSGALLQTADSLNGVAVINAPVTQSGTYIVKTINLSLGPVQVWTAATPTVRR